MVTGTVQQQIGRVIPGLQRRESCSAARGILPRHVQPKHETVGDGQTRVGPGFDGATTDRRKSREANCSKDQAELGHGLRLP